MTPKYGICNPHSEPTPLSHGYKGGKLKAKNEIRISHLFKNVPEPFLRMIVTHELAHLKEKEHNKAFYKLCTHIEPQYHQLEFEVGCI
jgi:UTP pyrophosphatase